MAIDLFSIGRFTVHGYGLMIIKRIVEKNGGVYSIKQDELFSVTILI